MLNTTPIVAIVVTHNRKGLLGNCIEALLNQTHPCDIIVVDNASTDGTEHYLYDHGLLDDDRVHHIRLNQNLGGAGGFHHGLKYAVSHGWDWFWLMDDDALPEPSALQNLVCQAKQPNTIYGSVAIGIENEKRRLCWAKRVIDKGKHKFIEYYELLKDLQEVGSIAFLGFFIHRDMVQHLGLPDPGFFIYKDDQDYCERARKSGARIILVKSSIIIHPLERMAEFSLFGRNIRYPNMPPWKTYYDVRNRIFIARAHYRSQLWPRTIPNILVRSFCNIFSEKNKLDLLYAYTVAILDGLLNRRGKRLMP